MARARARRSAWWLLLLVLIAVVAVVRVVRQRPAPVEVYFVRTVGSGRLSSLAAVRRPAPPGPPEARLEAALRALLLGAGDPQLHTEIPEGTALLGVRVRDGIATVDLSATFAAGGGSTSMLGRVWQVVYTATQFADAPAAQILIDHKRVEALGGEGIVIGSPLRRPATPPSF
ncbi:MAG TPA: GerMN domain-containing protein [bacterium]|nr:GerMN domain-containing protein [bacterium]